MLQGKMKRGFCVSFVVWVVVVAAGFASVDGLNVWPMPESVSNGSSSLYLSKGFRLLTEGSEYRDESGILKDGFLRLLDVVESAHVVDGNWTGHDPLAALEGLHVVVFSLSDEVRGLNKKLGLEFGDQESELAEWTRTIRKQDSFLGNSIVLVLSVDFMLGVLICRNCIKTQKLDEFYVDIMLDMKL